MPSLPRSLPRICVALGVATSEELLSAAQREYEDGNTFLEFRLDYLRNPSSGIAVIRTFRSRYPDCQILATCRHRDHHGFFTGTLLDQYVVLRAAAEAGAIAVDLEIESAERSHHEASLLRKLCALIISFHDFERTSALHIVWRRLNRVPADAYKLVTTIRKPSDTLRLVQFMREHAQAPLIAMGMSEAGSTTRILGPSLGSLYTYAAPSDSNGTASGQLSSGLLRSLYSCDTITQQTRLYGVVGDPISHTKSPLLHNRAFHSRRMDAVYLPFLVASSQLGEWMKLALALPIAGFSVTIPHKQRILRYLDAVEPLAHRIGAVNTVWRDTGKWRGTNTDVDGVLKPLSGHLRLSGSSVIGDN